MDNSRTLERHCTDGVCHCDWRLTITNCEEATAMWYVNLINIILSGFVIILGCALMFHRMVNQGHRLWDSAKRKGCFRPKPVDMMLFLVTIYNCLRLVSSVILMADISPDNLLARSFLFEFPWQFGYGGIAMYLVGIAQTLSESQKVAGWLPSPRTVDIVGCWFFFWPFVIDNICSLISGALATSDLEKAEVFAHLLYGFWFLHCSTLGCAVLFAGVRLVYILRGHLEKFSQTHARYKALHTGIFKIQIIVTILVICLWGFAALLLLYSILRDRIMTSTVGSVIFGTIWTYLGVLSAILVETAIVINPSMFRNQPMIFGTESSSGGGTYNDQAGRSTTLQDGHQMTSIDGEDAISKAIALNEQRFKKYEQKDEDDIMWSSTVNSNKVKSYNTSYNPSYSPTNNSDDASSKLELAMYGK